MQLHSNIGGSSLEALVLADTRVQAIAVTVGLFTFVSVGLAVCLALAVGVFYLVVSFVLLLFQAIGEVFSSLAAAWVGADLVLKLLLLGLAVYGSYRFYRYKRGGKYA